jgi:hypothetical protein
VGKNLKHFEKNVENEVRIVRWMCDDHFSPTHCLQGVFSDIYLGTIAPRASAAGIAVF